MEREKGEMERKRRMSFFVGMNIGNNCSIDVNFSIRLDGYYFYVLLFWYNAVVSMQVHHFDFVFFCFYSNLFYLCTCLLSCLLTSLLVHLMPLLYFQTLLNAVISFWFAHLYARFAACICKRTVTAQSCSLYALKFLVDWAVHTHAMYILLYPHFPGNMQTNVTYFHSFSVLTTRRHHILPGTGIRGSSWLQKAMAAT